MYTAIIKSKEETQQGLRITVDFTDGVNTLTETVIPQDEVGLKHWVKSRLTSLNSIAEIDTKYAIDSVIDTNETVISTQSEIDRGLWFAAFGRMASVQKLIDYGIIPASHPRVVALKKELTDNIKLEYIDLM